MFVLPSSVLPCALNGVVFTGQGLCLGCLTSYVLIKLRDGVLDKDCAHGGWITLFKEQCQGTST